MFASHISFLLYSEQSYAYPSLPYLGHQHPSTTRICHLSRILQRLLHHFRIPIYPRGLHTVTSTTVAMPNPNAAREVHCNHPWELHLALVGTNKVQTLGYKSVPESRDAAHSSWRYSHFKTTTPLQHFAPLVLTRHLVLDITSCCLDWCWSPSRHALNQLLRLLNWYPLPFLLNPLL